MSFWISQQIGHIIHHKQNQLSCLASGFYAPCAKISNSMHLFCGPPHNALLACRGLVHKLRLFTRFLICLLCFWPGGYNPYSRCKLQSFRPNPLFRHICPKYYHRDIHKWRHPNLQVYLIHYGLKVTSNHHFCFPFPGGNFILQMTLKSKHKQN